MTSDAQVLDDHIEEVRDGADLSDVLERCPEDLRSELRTAIDIDRMPQVVPSAEGKARGRGKLDAAVRGKRARRFGQKRAA